MNPEGELKKRGQQCLSLTDNMKTTVIPAQITTVEDKIAGNLNLTQIVLLIIPAIFTAGAYTVMPPNFTIVWYKLPFIFAVLAICLLLALRIRGKIVLSWLMVLVRFNLRAKYYVFNKNNAFSRNMSLPEFEKKRFKLFNFNFFKKTEEFKKSEINIAAKSFNLKDLIKLKDFIQNPNYSLSFKTNSKGGIYVSLSEK